MSQTNNIAELELDYSEYSRLVWRLVEEHNDDIMADDVDFTSMFKRVLAKHGGELELTSINNVHVYVTMKFNCAQQLTLWMLKYM